MESLNLNSLVARNIKIELKDEEYIIPQQPPMEFVIQYYELQQKAAKSKKPDEQMNTLIEACTMILNQDENKNVTNDFVKKNLSVTQLQKLAEFYQSQIQKVESDPN
jgi:hypothetical protein